MFAPEPYASASLTGRLTAVLAVGAVILSALVTIVTSEVGRDQQRSAAHAQMLDASASLARRAGPLLERGDELRLSVLATSVAELSRARVLVLDRAGVVRIDTGVGLGGHTLGLAATDGPFRRERPEPDTGFEAIAPAMGHEGGAGEVWVRYALAAPPASGFAWGTFGLVLLCSLSLITMAFWISHSWVRRIRAITRRARGIVRGDAVAQTEAIDVQLRSGGAVSELEQAVTALGASREGVIGAARRTGVALGREVVHALELRGHVAAGHPERVRRHGLALADALELPFEQTEDLGLACLLADVGKAGVRPSALAKAHGLDEVERASLRQHPTRGASLLAGIPGLEGVAQTVRHQYERWDGAGFPDGLRGPQIPLGSRILAVASAYENLVSGGVLGHPVSWPEALDRLREDRGELFDPDLVDALEDLVRSTPPRESTQVEISRKGVVPHRLPYGEPAPDVWISEEDVDLVGELDDELEVVFDDRTEDPS
ncbi:MAG: HD domain-containing protein [Planctomycetota bacterium]|nr:HD domain-containing protein [Planctomycetota bacterium]MDA0934391.1 HD domain-containing protein [Planctomycetota bacterium]MDA1222146.1 HD domain-containing protein [Planctomycetota bacterium]